MKRQQIEKKNLHVIDCKLNKIANKDVNTTESIQIR